MPSPSFVPLRRAAALAVLLAGAVLAGLAAGPALADPVATCSVPGTVTAHPGRTQLIYAGCTPSTAVPASVRIDLPAHGTVTALSNLTFRYTADDGYTGSASFTVHPAGADGQAWPDFTVAIDVSATANTAPNCGYGSGRVITRQEKAVIVPINACYDADGDPLTVAVTTNPAHGAVSAARPAATGGGYEVTYTPDPGFAGADTIGYAATDDHGDRSAEATVGVDVHPLGTNEPPFCPPSAPFIPGMTPPTADATVFIGQNTVWLGCRDSDGDPITLTFVQPPAHGTVVAGPDPSRPTFTYTSIGGYTGPDALVVELSDGQGGTLRKAMTLHVGNHFAECGLRVDAAIAGRGAAADPGVTIRRPCTDPDGDPLTAKLWTPPVHGTVQFDDAAGTLTYTPDVGFSGDDLVGFHVDDGHYGLNYGQVLFHVGPAATDTRAPASPRAKATAAAIRDPAALRAASLLGGPAVAFDLGLGTAARGFVTVAKTVADGRALAVVLCAKACTLGVDGRLRLSGENGGARGQGTLKLVHHTLKAKAGGSAVIRLSLTKAQRSRIAHATKATVTLALTARAGQKARSVHRVFTVRR
ncbi:MAG TPA: Ig-like domain-containing protein [Baekduia sp.]|nr:Ig-like domain-containing protein [Baekduia sp.]